MSLLLVFLRPIPPAWGRISCPCTKGRGTSAQWKNRSQNLHFLLWQPPLLVSLEASRKYSKCNNMIAGYLATVRQMPREYDHVTGGEDAARFYNA